MRKKLLKAFFYISGFICLYCFLAIRFMPLFNLVSTEKVKPGYWDNTKYGELYYFSNIRHFREEMPPALPKYQFSDKHPNLQQAEVLTFGDSYLDWSRHVQLASRLNDSLNMPVYFRYDTQLIAYLSENDYKNSHAKYVLLAITERWIPWADYGIGIDKKHPGKNNNDNSAMEFLRNIRNFLFVDRSDELYSALIQRSYFIGNLNSIISTLKFNWFGYISSLTPKYAIEEDRPWLFYIDQLNDDKTSYYYPHTESDIENIAKNIKQASDSLWQEYCLKLVFMPVPSKYTIYHYIVDPDAEYNEFLPRLYSQLDVEGVNYIDLLEPFRKSDEYIFYGTDDHWTEAGISIATSKVLKILRDNKEKELDLMRNN